MEQALRSLPIDLTALLQFTLLSPVSQNLTHAVTNNFFTLSSNSRIIVQDDGGGPWAAVPCEWRTWCDTVAGIDREKVLESLANGNPMLPTDAEREYLVACKTLSLDRICSDDPVLSHPPHTFTSPPHTFSPIIAEGVPVSQKNVRGKKTAPPVGQSPKKCHEVEKFTKLVSSILKDEDPPTNVVDVGSGRAHLSRALANPPLSLQVLALDYDPSQTSGADRLSDLDSRFSRLTAGGPGSLTSKTLRLDAQNIRTALMEWDGKDRESHAMLVALHACGDLTCDALRALVELEKEGASKRKAVCVGCCYNLLTPTNFPMSQHVASLLTSLNLPDHPLTRSHLRLTPQSPPTWYLSPVHSKALRFSVLKLAFRARLEVELEVHGYGGERGIGRVADSAYSSYSSYRAKALMKYGEVAERWKEIPFGETGAEGEWEEALWKLQFYWTLRSWFGPPLESLLLLDRWLYVVEELQESLGDRRVELLNLFEQSTGSLRNVAIVVR